MPERISSIAGPLAATLLLLGAACSLTWLSVAYLPPHLVDQCLRQGDEARAAASVVVVGVLERDIALVRRIPMQSNPTYPLQLRKITVRVENVLRGAAVPKAIDVYYFTWAGPFDGPRPMGFWRPGDRRILWLQRDSGVFRTTCDGWDYCTLGVQSGAHPGYRPDPRKSLDFAVADLFFTRGEGPVNNAAFAAEVAWGVPDRGLEDYVVAKLRQLTLTERDGVKSAACNLLWVYTQDGYNAGVQRDAAGALRDADCRCATKSGGNPDCRPL